ncbi:lantibiotic ABC transporter permease [Enterococcus rivorum]|uniref:Lantibiotic ABC transporter permease n=1 Tax=Enterococcus rivorum TaxID=762845 RepID=A0A1E5KYC5_9ENTE|nr:lantibiotic ABC transporter permease [Enterococcus rivorum]MBP2099568.1 hypothetical protein [Enterococcus rivorum]OEH82890.1 lantibiotic ABC transporter permease [Enterococcus rivorum]
MDKNNSVLAKAIVTLTFIFMVGMNMAAVLLPLNGVTTQAVSDKYANLFAPAGLTFSVWSVIYLLLALFVFYQWKPTVKNSVMKDENFSKKIRILFIISSLLNGVWLVAWQYFQLELSVLIMLCLLITLILINNQLVKETFNLKESVFLRLPFSVYFGWITVATIANITALLVSKNISFLQSNQVFWTITILIIGLVIAGATIVKNRDTAYGLTVFWAYLGILIKHLSSTGWNNNYPSIILTVIGCLIVLLALCVYGGIRNRKNRKIHEVK